MQLWYRSQLNGKKYQPTIWYRAKNWSTPLVPRNDFSYESILAKSIAWAKLNDSGSSVPPVPDEKWWKKLCSAAVDKHPQLSKFGAQLLQDKLVRSLGGRLLFDKLYEENKDEIERFYVHEPIFCIGLPRSSASMAAHMNSRSGHFMSFRGRDAMFPGVPSELERVALSRQVFKRAGRLHPQLLSVFHLDPEKPSSDVTLNMMNPRALAWGMLHGFNDYLYECIQEDQEHVFDFMQRVMKVFQWYRQCGEFSECVTKEINEIWVPEQQVRDGRRLVLDRIPWFVHSPFALLHIAQLHKVFPDMRLIWCHRAVSQCVSSMCAAIAIHHTVHTGTSLTSSQLAEIGEMVCGIFGSGSEQAIEYLGEFPYDRMVHWHNKDIGRSGVRLVTKTLEAFDIPTDRFRRQQIIEAMSEWNSMYRPKLDSELAHFGLHEGIVGEHFEVYMTQFKEYAFEPKFGIRMEDYQFLGHDYDKQRFAFGDVKKTDRKTSFPMLQPPGGKHSLLDPQNRTRDGMYRPTSPHE